MYIIDAKKRNFSIYFYFGVCYTQITKEILPMGVLLVLAQNVVHSFESISTRTCSKRHGNGGLAYNAIICFFAFCVALITGITEGLNFPPEIWIFGLISGVFYLGGFYYAFKAFQTGPFTIIKLISAFGMLAGIFYGIIVRNEKITLILISGIVLIFVAIFLTNSDNKKNDKKSSSRFWLIYTLLFMLCNAGIAVLSLMQQDRFYVLSEAGGKVPTCNTEFLIISYAFAFTSLMTISLVKNFAATGIILKKCFPYGVITGGFNALHNLLSLEANRYIEQTIKAPLSTGISLAIGFVIGFIVFKERFSKKQILGLFVGTAAISLLLVYNALK